MQLGAGHAQERKAGALRAYLLGSISASACASMRVGEPVLHNDEVAPKVRAAVSS